MVEPKKEEPKTAPQDGSKAAPAPEGSLQARIQALEAENAQLRKASVSAAPTHMIAPTGKMVKIKAKTDIRLVGDQVVKAGTVVDVPEEVAKEFCDLKFIGPYKFGGERSEATADRHVTVRAERVA